MFFAVTPDYTVDDRTIVGIFDLDTATYSQITRKFLRDCQKDGRLATRSRDLPKSFLVCDETVCLLQTSSSSLTGKSR